MRQFVCAAKERRCASGGDWGAAAMSIDYPTSLRVFAFFSAKPSVSREDLLSGLNVLRPALAKRFGAQARIDLGVRREIDPFGAIAGDRKIESADAILQLSYPERHLLGDLLNALRGFADELNGLIDVGRSSLSVGVGLQIVDCPGDVFLGFVGRRRPDLIQAQMSLWWLNRHAPLALKMTGHLIHHGYAQLHLDRDASSQAAAAAGFPHVPYDMGDAIDIPDLDLFMQVQMRPEVQAALFEDEQQFLDHNSWRVVVCDRI